MPPRGINWLLLGRYALLTSLTLLIPVPLVDRGIENFLRRRLVRAIAAGHDRELPEEAVRSLADAPGGGCVGCVWSVVLWPIRKLLKTALIFLQAKSIADVASEVLHRGLMLEEALEAGWLDDPNDADAVRAAMDRALAKVDIRLMERTLRGVFQDHRDELNLAVWEATRIARERASDPDDELEMSPEAEALSSAMTAAVRGTGVVPELLQWFRAEMGEPPRLPQARLEGGLVEPEVLPPDEQAPDDLPAEPDISDAVEVPEFE